MTHNIIRTDHLDGLVLSILVSLATLATSAAVVRKHKAFNACDPMLATPDYGATTCARDLAREISTAQATR